MAVWMESCSHFSKSSSWVVTFIINIMQHFAASLLFILHDPSSRTVLSSIKLLYFVSESFLYGLGKLIKNILYLHWPGRHWLNLINDTVLLLVITLILWIHIKVIQSTAYFYSVSVNLNFPTILWKKFNPLCYLMSWCRFLVPGSWFLVLGSCSVRVGCSCTWGLWNQDWKTLNKGVCCEVWYHTNISLTHEYFTMHKNPLPNTS